MPDAPDDVAVLRAKNGRLRVLLEDKGCADCGTGGADGAAGAADLPEKVRRVPGAKSKQPPAWTLLECLRHREADVLRFLTYTAIPPTSNQAERDLRASKAQQKIRGRLRSEKTTRDRYAIRGYGWTAVKRR
jgi:hypothetical protein